MHPIGTGYYYNLFTISNYPQKGPRSDRRTKQTNTNRSDPRRSQRSRGDPNEISHARKGVDVSKSLDWQLKNCNCRGESMLGPDFTWLPSINYGEQVRGPKSPPPSRVSLSSEEARLPRPNHLTYLIIEWLPPSRPSALLSTRNHLGINNVFV